MLASVWHAGCCEHVGAKKGCHGNEVTRFLETHKGDGRTRFDRSSYPAEPGSVAQRHAADRFREWANNLDVMDVGTNLQGSEASWNDL
jgi:hypothetical protein